MGVGGGSRGGVVSPLPVAVPSVEWAPDLAMVDPVTGELATIGLPALAMLTSSSSLSSSSSGGAGCVESGSLQNKAELRVTVEPSGLRAVTMEPFVAVTTRGLGQKGVQSLFCFGWRTRTLSPDEMPLGFA